MDGLADIKSKIIKRGDKSKNPGEEGADENSADGVPDKKLVDAGYIGKNSGGGGGNQGV